MSIISTVFEVVFLISIPAIVYGGFSIIKKYFEEKGKNLATKQDIAKITHEIESIKLIYQKSILKYSNYQKRQAHVISKIYRHVKTL